MSADCALGRVTCEVEFLLEGWLWRMACLLRRWTVVR
jgi:hypothetical protein